MISPPMTRLAGVLELLLLRVRVKAGEEEERVNGRVESI